MPAVELADLVVRYGDVVAVDGAAFHVDAGEVVALLGINGAGKSTTIDVLEGLLRPNSGTVRVLDHDPWDQRDVVTPRIGAMPQEPDLPPSARPIELVRLFQRLKGSIVDPAAALEQVGLLDRGRSTVRKLSGGERQRLSLALALIGRPEVLFLDEPTAGVDLAGRVTIRELVAERVSEGAAVLLTTHELDEAQRMADRIVIIDRGRVIASGTPAELADAVEETPRLRFATDEGLDVIALSTVVDGHVVEESAGEYVAAVEPTPQTVAALTAWMAEQGVAVHRLDSGRASLDEVFTKLTTTAQDGDTPTKQVDEAGADERGAEGGDR